MSEIENIQHVAGILDLENKHGVFISILETKEYYQEVKLYWSIEKVTNLVNYIHGYPWTLEMFKDLGGEENRLIPDYKQKYNEFYNEVTRLES